MKILLYSLLIFLAVVAVWLFSGRVQHTSMSTSSGLVKVENNFQIPSWSGSILNINYGSHEWHTPYSKFILNSSIIKDDEDWKVLWVKVYDPFFPFVRISPNSRNFPTPYPEDFDSYYNYLTKKSKDDHIFIENLSIHISNLGSKDSIFFFSELIKNYRLNEQGERFNP